MPELPEVEVLARFLRPLLCGKKIKSVRVARPRVLRPTSKRELSQTLRGARVVQLSRRGKYLLFSLNKNKSEVVLVGHLGMSGRMYFLPGKAELPKHASVVLDFGKEQFVFEDTRYFGRFTLDAGAIKSLGPEPLSAEFTVSTLLRGLERSEQPIKVKLLDQKLVAGIGNIYASEALFRAGISPVLQARLLTPSQARRLWEAIREVLNEAIQQGSSVPLDYNGLGRNDGFFYFGRAPEIETNLEERFRVYDRSEEACYVCQTPIKRLIQAGRSTFYCPRCQGARCS